MSRFRRYKIVEQSPPFCIHESSLITPTSFSLNPFYPSSSSSLFLIEKDYHIDCPFRSQYPIDILPPFYDDFDQVSDLIQFENNPFHRRVRHHHRPGGLESELYMQRLSDRVSALELGIDRLGNVRRPRKYSWTTEMKNPERHCLDRKYKWAPLDKTYKFTAKIKGNGDSFPIKRRYKFGSSSSSGNAGLIGESSKKNWRSGNPRFLDITDPTYDHGALVLKQAFARSVERIRGKRHELSLQDSAILIQRTFRGYLIRRSQVLRGLRDLAIAKAKLKEIRAWFNNFSYRRRVAHDAEERQRFAEKIIVLLLTVDAIQGVDLMTRTAKRSIVYELEAMLHVVDPDPSGRFQPMRRRTFDMPDGGIQKEVAAGVAQIVQMIEDEM